VEQVKDTHITDNPLPACTVSISPHIKSRESTAKIMWTVNACLLPPLILSVCIFGFQTLIITLVSVLSCVITEAVSQKLLHRPITIKDGSAVITGLLLAYVIPPGVPYWMPILGAVMAIYITKHLFGGLGFNIFNPALIGRAFLVATFPVAMTSAWIVPIQDFSIFKYMQPGVDAVATATPLYVLKHYGLAAVIEKYGALSTMYKDFFLGVRPGCIGEVSNLLLLLGGAVLIFKKYISWHIPVSTVVSVGVLTWIFGGEGYFSGDPILAVLTGGIFLGAIFMATDYTTTPLTKHGRIVFAIGCGLLTVVIRLVGGYPEGVSYSILFMNVMTPLIDKLTMPKAFGKVKK